MPQGEERQARDVAVTLYFRERDTPGNVGHRELASDGVMLPRYLQDDRNAVREHAAVAEPGNHGALPRIGAIVADQHLILETPLDGDPAAAIVALRGTRMIDQLDDVHEVRLVFEAYRPGSPVRLEPDIDGRCDNAQLRIFEGSHGSYGAHHFGR